MIRDATPDQVERGAFDPATLTESFEMEWQAEDGPRSLPIRQRGYVPSELVLLCRESGSPSSTCGEAPPATGAAAVELDEMEIMAVLRRPA